MPDCKDKLFKDYFSRFKHYGINLYVRLVSMSHYSELPTLKQSSVCLYILFMIFMKYKLLSKTKQKISIQT